MEYLSIINHKNGMHSLSYCSCMLLYGYLTHECFCMTPLHLQVTVVIRWLPQARAQVREPGTWDCDWIYCHQVEPKQLPPWSSQSNCDRKRLIMHYLHHLFYIRVCSVFESLQVPWKPFSEVCSSIVKWFHLLIWRSTFLEYLTKCFSIDDCVIQAVRCKTCNTGK